MNMGRAQKLKQQRKIEWEEQKKDKKKKNLKKTIIFSVILICIVAVIAGIFFFVEYFSKKDIRQVVIETEKGNIELELYSDIAPKTVENFIKLTEEGFYDGTKFHRVEPNFVIQGGDPLSKDDDPINDGTGGPGYTFEDEINPIALNMNIKETKELEQLGYKYTIGLKSIPHETGVISMANRGPNTNGSQFFIITGPAQKDLDGLHTVFGRVVEGMDVAKSIEQGDVMRKVYIAK